MSKFQITFRPYPAGRGSRVHDELWTIEGDSLRTVLDAFYSKPDFNPEWRVVDIEGAASVSEHPLSESAQTPIEVPLTDKTKEELLRFTDMMIEDMRWYVGERNRLTGELEAALAGVSERELALREALELALDIEHLTITGDENRLGPIVMRIKAALSVGQAHE